MDLADEYETKSIFGFDADQRNRLPKTSLRACPFQPEGLELFGDIQGRRLAAFRACASPFQAIVGKKLYVRAQSVFAKRTRQR